MPPPRCAAARPRYVFTMASPVNITLLKAPQAIMDALRPGAVPPPPPLPATGPRPAQRPAVAWLRGWLPGLRSGGGRGAAAAAWGAVGGGEGEAAVWPVTLPGLAHAEKNWGEKFPPAYVWAQGVATEREVRGAPRPCEARPPGHRLDKTSSPARAECGSVPRASLS